MERKKILIIGMFDSIHLVRWLKQFKNEPVDFILFPSKKFRSINPELSKLIKSKNLANYYLTYPYKLHFFIGYIDFVLIKIGNILGINLRKNGLKKILTTNDFDLIHALEIQGAGYLYSELPLNIIGDNKLILTNWGSDIYFFAKDKGHNEKISKVVAMAAYYSAECERDYELLKNYNFIGRKLPCIPNGGGFSLEELNSYKTSASKRNLILCKAYGGMFGMAQLAMPAIDKALNKFENLNAFFYSVTPDTENLVKLLINKYGSRVKYSTVSGPLSRKELLYMFSQARVYIGCSKSDAISTSFLESLVYGAYPIQTNTSCADEWINKGAIATLVGLEVAEIIKALELVLIDDELVNYAQIKNSEIAKKYLDESFIKVAAKQFYLL
jgi:hypothetical protein